MALVRTAQPLQTKFGEDNAQVRCRCSFHVSRIPHCLWPPGPQGAKGDQGPPGPGLSVMRQDSCPGSSSCNFACEAGETIASITCPQGEISITKTGSTETASCSNSPGPALAICVRQ